MVTMEEWAEHQKTPAHKLYKKYLNKLREDIKEEWAMGHYTRVEADGTIQLNAKHIGMVELLSALIEETTYEEVIGTLAND